MSDDTLPKVLAALAGLAGDILETAAKDGKDPLAAIEALRASLRAGIVATAQAELDAKFGQ